MFGRLQRPWVLGRCFHRSIQWQLRGLITEHGMISKWNDLHKGRDCGIPWSIVIDLSALIMIVSGATGLAMLLYMKKKRTSGLWATVVGTLAFVSLCWLLVP